jgi:hypothetical protein
MRTTGMRIKVALEDPEMGIEVDLEDPEVGIKTTLGVTLNVRILNCRSPILGTVMGIKVEEGGSQDLGIPQIPETPVHRGRNKAPAGAGIGVMPSVSAILKGGGIINHPSSIPSWGLDWTEPSRGYDPGAMWVRNLDVGRVPGAMGKFRIDPEATRESLREPDSEFDMDDEDLRRDMPSRRVFGASL